MQVVGLIRHQFGLLAEIYHAEGLKQQDYAEKLQVTKGNIFQHLDRLVFRGFAGKKARLAVMAKEVSLTAGSILPQVLGPLNWIFLLL